MRKRLIASLLIFLLIGAGISYLVMWVEEEPPSGKLPEDSSKVVEIPKGAGLRDIAALLKREGVTQTPLFFIIKALWKGSRGRLKAGEYRFSSSMTLDEILHRLESGKVILHPLTIPEGFTVEEIARLLEEKGLSTREKFLALTSKKEFLDRLGLEGKSLEGYLFPETYFFPKGASEETIVKKIVSTFDRVFTEGYKDRAKLIGLTPHQVLTLASVIEKEAKVDEERALISAVYHNRLKRGMLLQSDPTVIYALKQFDGNLRKEDLAIDSPYNTYKYPGLPPGPIANPGRASIEAALFPAPVDYLYFVSKNNGEHSFSTSLQEHNNAVKKYQR
ncbi:MAG: endolytic transglycosylase MltG [Candidatus Tectomicrobia bacterium]|nr:endolytic transglycosylase MltG [Candidatus Tectomicrobia bacterium]